MHFIVVQHDVPIKNMRLIKPCWYKVDTVCATSTSVSMSGQKVYKSKGIDNYCDLQSWLYLKGTTIDFSDDILSGGFKISNPNASRTCGCGTSFSV